MEELSSVVNRLKAMIDSGECRQEEIAASTGISMSTLVVILNGKNKNPTLRIYQALRDFKKGN